MIQLDALPREWPIKGTFRIARGAKTIAHTIEARVTANGLTGRGEAVPYGRYGETMESCGRQIQSAAAGLSRFDDPKPARQWLQTALPAGAARNALDCALWDLDAKAEGKPVWQLADLPKPRPCKTAFTIPLGPAEEMAAQAAQAVDNGHATLKLKLGDAATDPERLRSVRAAVGDRPMLIADVNEGWRPGDLEALYPAIAQSKLALLEQPCPSGDDLKLNAGFGKSCPLCADESFFDRSSFAQLPEAYGAVNVKLDKTGGLTEAILVIKAARAKNLQVFLGCMVASSLAIAPALLLAPLVDYVDLDGALLLKRDRSSAIPWQPTLGLGPAPATLWGHPNS